MAATGRAVALVERALRGETFNPWLWEVVPCAATPGVGRLTLTRLGARARVKAMHGAAPDNLRSTMGSWPSARAVRPALVRACPVVPLAAGCGDKAGKHAGVPHSRLSPAPGGRHDPRPGRRGSYAARRLERD
jgi:hypothetical protein